VGMMNELIVGLVSDEGAEGEDCVIRVYRVLCLVAVSGKLNMVIGTCACSTHMLASIT